MAKIIWRKPKQENRDDGQPAGEAGEQGQMAQPMVKAVEDDKLEIKSDGAWFAAELTLRDADVRVHFNDYNHEEDESWSVERVKNFKPLRNHIRVVSAQLQDEECGIVSVNKPVCAFKDFGSKEGWFDGTVTEITRRPHTSGDGGEICTCCFSVIWLEGPGKGRIGRNLRCEDICTLSKKDVDTHPLILDILRHGSDMGGAQDQEQEKPSPSALKGKKRERDTDDSVSDVGGARDQEKETPSSSSLEGKRRERDTDDNVSDVGGARDQQKEISSSSALEEKRGELDTVHNVRDVGGAQDQAEEIPSSSSLKGKRKERDTDHNVAAVGGAHDLEKETPSSSALTGKRREIDADDIVRDVGGARDLEKDTPSASALTGKRRGRDTHDNASSLDEPGQVDFRRFKRLKSKTATVSSVTPSEVLDEASQSSRLASKPNSLPRSTLVDAGLQGEPIETNSAREESGKGTSTGNSTQIDCKKLPQMEKLSVPLPDPFQEHKMVSNSLDTSRSADVIGRSPGISLRFHGSEQTPKNITCEVGDFKEPGRVSAKVEPPSIDDVKQQPAKMRDSSEEALPSKKTVHIVVGFDIEVEASVSKCEAFGVSVDQIRAGPKVEASVSRCEELGDSFDKTSAGPRVHSYVAKCEEFLGSTVKPRGEPKAEPSAVTREELLDSSKKSSAEPAVKPCVSAELLGSAIGKDEACASNADREPVGSVGKDKAFASDTCEELDESMEKRSLRYVSPRADLLGSVDKNSGGPKVNQSVAHPVEDRPKVGLGSSSVRSNDRFMDSSKSCSGLGSSGMEPICVSDDEDERGTTPSTSRSRLTNQMPGSDANASGKEGRDVNPGTRARKTNSLIRQFLATSRCVLKIENLEMGVEPADVLDQVSTLFNSEKVRSVHVPPRSHPEMIYDVGYVVFLDKESTDTAFAFLTRNYIVSARGRPWIVSRQVAQDMKEDCFDFLTVSAFKGEGQDGSGGSLGGYRLVTDKQQPDYDAAKRRIEVFQQHKRQTRVLFQRHYQEEKDLDANPNLSLYR